MLASMAQHPTLKVSATVESWPLAQPFVISRGAKTAADVLVASISDGLHVGRGECVPYARYGEGTADVERTILNWAPSLDRATLHSTLPAGAARNAIDCALWDLEAKQSGTSTSQRLGVPLTAGIETAFTLSLAAPDDMAQAAKRANHLKLLKLKLGGGREDAQRMRAVRTARPDARLIADANEAWTARDLGSLMQTAAELEFEMVEQPLPAENDAALADLLHPLPVCADESHHTEDDLRGLVGRYDAINVKLDKAGGLTAALDAVATARALNFKVMIGSMVATSLAIAPAFVLAHQADWIDLDGPLLLTEDRKTGFRFDKATMSPPPAGLWGTPD